MAYIFFKISKNFNLIFHPFRIPLSFGYHYQEIINKSYFKDVTNAVIIY